MVPDLDAGIGEWGTDLDANAHSSGLEGSVSLHLDDSRDAVPRPAPRALHDETPGVDERPKAVLKGAPGRRGFERFADLRGRRPFRVSLHCFQNREQVLFGNASRHWTLRRAGRTVRAIYLFTRKFQR